jgi:peroxisomal 2,4-dienoyl-CoA reductase
MSERPASPPALFVPDLLAGKVALVTGGGTGIGFGIASCLTRAGAAVAIASRKPEHLEPAVAELRRNGGAAIATEANVREPESVARMVDRVTAELGRLDILVNNAAGNFYAPSASLSPNAWRAVVETDLYGTFYCCQAAYPALKASGAGRIISISMTLHYRGWPLMAHATAAKAGVDALTRTLALEWAGDRITVNAVAPGPIPTEGVKTAFTPPSGDAPDVFRMDAFARREIPAGRWGTPEDIGQLVTYLASPAAEWITGAIMVVDGGQWLAAGRQ